MILADTSVWVNHLRHTDVELARLLVEEEVGLHPFVLGELAAGHLRRRGELLAYLKCLPQLPLAQEDQVHQLLESQHLYGRGLGWVDLHLLASARLSGWRIFTADRALQHAATQLDIGYGR